MAKVGRFIRDPKAGSYCQMTLESGEKIIVSHDKWRLTIELSKLFGFSSDTIFAWDLDSPEGRAALATLTRKRAPGKRGRNPARRVRELCQRVQHRGGREGSVRVANLAAMTRRPHGRAHEAEGGAHRLRALRR